MSDMLATSEREVPPIRGRSGTELPRIDLRADRHRRSSAMILLGLPAMLMFGFGAAYVYHASSYDPARVFEQAREAIPASIAAIPGLVADPPKPKISESIIQKQEAAVAPTKVAAAPSEPLPPPVAPPVEPAVAPATTPAAPAEPATAEVTPAAPQARRVAQAEPVTKVPDRLPEPARIEPAAAAVTSALMIAPAEGNVAELPKPLTPQPLPGEDGEETNETTVSALPAPAAKEASPVKARSAPANTRVAALTPASEPGGEEAGEVGQLIARGNERMEIGDIAAARLLFELAAESGSPVAATAMGRSYDPVHFIRVGVRGVKPDAEKAREWYQKAVKGGNQAAEDDLRNLTTWLTTQ